MLTQGRFLISYQVFDNIQVKDNGQTHVHVCEILNDTQAFTINYRTEQIRDYLKYPGEELIPEHLHMINALKEIQTKIKDIIYNNLYDTLIDELKGTISRFQAQYNIQEINPYLQDILQNPEDLVSLSQHHKR